MLADVAAKARGKLPVIAPLALEAVRRIDAIFAIEREINGLTVGRAARRPPAADRRPLVADLEGWMRAERARLSRHADVAKAMDYMLKRWAAFTRFLDDGRICLTNNAAERALRGIALGRKAWLFAGSDRGGERAALMYTLIHTARLNDVDPQAWLADVLARINDHRARDLDQLLPWNWTQDRGQTGRMRSPPSLPASRSRSTTSSPPSCGGSRCRSTCGSTGCIWSSRRRWAGPTAISGSSAPRRRLGHPRSRMGSRVGSARRAQGNASVKVIEDTGAEDAHLSLRLRRRLGAHDQDRAHRTREPGPDLSGLIEAIGRCPPEDVGGPPGYEEFLAALADPVTSAMPK